MAERKGFEPLPGYCPATAFRVLYPERTLVEIGRKSRPVLEAPESLQSRLSQDNFTYKAAWRQGKFELTASAPQMASKTGKRREFGEKGEKTGENTGPDFTANSGILMISLERKNTDLLLLAKKMRGV